LLVTVRKLREIPWQIGLKYEMGRASSKQGSKNTSKQENPKGKIYFGKLGVDGKISQPVLRNSMWTGFIRMRARCGSSSASAFHKGGTID
jgi:hypothetical protein